MNQPPRSTWEKTRRHDCTVAKRDTCGVAETVRLNTNRVVELPALPIWYECEERARSHSRCAAGETPSRCFVPALDVNSSPACAGPTLLVLDIAWRPLPR